MKDFISDTIEFCKMAGWRGVICEMFNINSNHHQMYKYGFKEGCDQMYDTGGPITIDYMINHLRWNIPSCEPFRTRALCQIRGFEDAKKMRSIAKREPYTPLPENKEEIDEQKIIFIKIFDSERLSHYDKGKALASYIKLNELDLYPLFGKERQKERQEGIYAFVQRPSYEESVRSAKKREIKNEKFYKRIVKLVKMEIVTP